MLTYYVAMVLQIFKHLVHINMEKPTNLSILQGPKSKLKTPTVMMQRPPMMVARNFEKTPGTHFDFTFVHVVFVLH